MIPNRADLLANDLIWLLSIEYAGRLWRWSSEPITLTDASGDVQQFDGGLEGLDVEQVLPSFGESPDMLSASLDLMWPSDVALLVSQGHDLSAATGELALFVRGTSFDDRYVLIDGNISQPQYGDANEPVSLTLEEHPFDDGALIPAATAIISEDAGNDGWDNDGDQYPLPFGGVGEYTTALGGTKNLRQSPAILADATAATEVVLLIVAGHHVPTTTNTVTIGTTVEDDWYSGTATLTRTIDGLGQQITQATLTTAHDAVHADFRHQSKYWVRWTHGSSLPDDVSGTPITGAGSLITWMLRRSSLRFDHESWGSATTALNEYQVHGYINEQVTPWQWVEENLLPLLPVTIHASSAGLYPVIWRHDATTADAVERITAGAGILRVGAVEYDKLPTDTTQHMQLDWAYDDGDGEHRRTTIIRPADNSARLKNEMHSVHTQTSASRYANTNSLTVSSDVVYDAATATRVMSWWALAKGFTHRLIKYEMPQHFAWLRIGDVVTITDDGIHLTDEVALVRSVSRTDRGRLLVGLQLVEDVARGGYSTGVPTDLTDDGT